MQAAISGAKNELITPRAVSSSKIGDYFDGIVAKVYTLYQKKLQEQQLARFRRFDHEDDPAVQGRAGRAGFLSE